MNTQCTILLFLAIASLTVGGCVPQPPTGSPLITPQPDYSTDPPSKVIKFTLKTETRGRTMVYVGVGGDIDGIVNPDLIVQPGDTVHAVMLNGDGLPHDLAFPSLDAHTSIVAGKGQKTDVTFEARANGNYDYYCTVSGHREAGMEGKLIVSELLGE